MILKCQCNDRQRKVEKWFQIKGNLRDITLDAIRDLGWAHCLGGGAEMP